MPKKSPPIPPQATALKSALRRLPGPARNTALAQHLGVDPSFVSQWATGHRPMPAKYAVAAGEFLNVPPGLLSLDYAEEITRHGGEAHAAPADLPAVIEAMQGELDALQTIAAVLVATMRKYRPIEAQDAGDTVHRLSQGKPRVLNHPLLRELLGGIGPPRKARGATSA